MTSDTLLIKIFEHYYSNIFEKGYRLNVTPNEKLIENFFKRLKKRGYNESSIGENFLNNFFIFQFNYWKDKETNLTPKLNWFIGKSAIERYFSIENIEKSNYFVALNTSKIENYKQKEEEDYSYKIELRKKRHNTKQGLLFCLEHTDLYIKCLPCITCIHKEECKKLLKENYPLLWKRRLNDG